MSENMIKRITEINNRVNSVKKDNKQKEKNISTQDLIRKMRKVNEEDRINRKTAQDQQREEENFRKNLEDLNVVVEFEDLEVYDDFIFWGGTIDGIIQFTYKVTPDEKTSGIEFNYLEDFSVDNPDNEEIVERIQSYYDQFYKYWRDNIFQTN